MSDCRVVFIEADRLVQMRTGLSSGLMSKKLPSGWCQRAWMHIRSHIAFPNKPLLRYI